MLLGVILIPGVGTSANNAIPLAESRLYADSTVRICEDRYNYGIRQLLYGEPGADQQGGYGRNRASSVRGSGSDDSGGAGSFDHVGDHVYFSVYDLRSKTKL